MIEVEGLVKTYGLREKLLVIDHISFAVPKGSIFGILGSKGAGKTTTLRILATTLRPTEGKVTIDGLDISSHVMEVRQRLGYSPENLDLREWATGESYLRFWAKASGLSRSNMGSARKRVVELMNIADVTSQELGGYTLDVQKRLSIAQALLRDPDVLVLDEPMIGLSPAARESLVGILRDLKGRGKTTVLSSHLLGDIRAACDRVAVMSAGRLTKVYETPSLLKKIGEGKDARIFVECEPLPASAVAALKKKSGVVDVVTTETATVVYINPGEVTAKAVRTVLEKKGVKVRGVREAEIKLGDVFSTLYT